MFNVRNVVMRGLRTCTGKLIAENLKETDLGKKTLLQIRNV